ncbi:conjugal transfer protein [Streptomyces sp. NPDC002835]
MAELFCDLWLRSDARVPDSDTAQSVRALAPEVDLPRSSTHGDAQRVVRTVAVRSAQLQESRWSVVVAAHFEAPAGRDSAQTSVRYFAVPIAVAPSAGGAGAFTVTGVPAQVAGPRTVGLRDGSFPHVLPARSALGTTLGEFFNAYLAGVGRVDRYLAPGTELAGVGGAAYVSVRLDEVAAESDAGDGPVPGDGTRVRVQAKVTAQGSGQARMPLRYTVVMAARSGRWEVSVIEAGAPATPVRSTGTESAQGGAQ